ncbi:MAG: PhnD/SsuA/transferrin family substrate-binding protein [Streptosporangiales bacterium]|nr:PhnD/SsuA/transferrin family substrate-binding protein [Streptosporangiales bacterium]
MRCGLVRLASAISLLVVYLATGCDGLGSSAAESGDLEKTKIKIGVLPIIDTAPVYVGIKKGVFAAEGLTVEPVMLEQSTEALPMLKEGKLDFAFGNYVNYFMAHADGSAKLRVQAEGYQSKPGVFVIVTMPNSPIRSPRDLAGKTLAVNIKDNISTLTTNEVIKTEGVDPGSLRYTEIPFPELEPALQNGSIDAAFMVEPFTSHAQQELGARVVMDNATGPTADFPIGGYFSTEKFAKQNPKTSAAFRRAMQRAQALAAERRNVEEVLPTYAKIDRKTASTITIGAFPTSLNLTRLQRVADLMHRQGLLKEKLDLQTMR